MKGTNQTQSKQEKRTIKIKVEINEMENIKLLALRAGILRSIKLINHYPDWSA